MNIEKLLPGIKKNISLKNYTTFKIGGLAKYFFEIKTKKDLIKAIIIAKKLKLPFFILGRGSNLLVSDQGYEGIIIKMQNTKNKIKNQILKDKIFCEAGTLLSLLVSKATKNNLTGMKWLEGIPGTIGGAARENVGAFGKSMAKIVKRIEIFNTKDLKFKTYNLKNCKFAYRDSIFKHKKNLIIFSIEISLKKGDKNKIKEKIKEYLNYRKEKHPTNLPSAGSIFKNPKNKIKNQILKEFSEIKILNQKGEIPAGWLIEKCNLKGKIIGDAKISEKHSNFIVNLGKGNAKNVINLINLIKKSVKKKFKIILEEEIQYLGF